METTTKTPPATTVDEYIKRFPPKVQATMQKLRKVIKAAAPKAEEVINYQIAGYKYYGMLVFFGAWENHIGLYPGTGAVKAFKKELSAYKGAKGTVQFPHAESIPFTLISKIVKFRVKENEERNAVKKKK